MLGNRSQTRKKNERVKGRILAQRPGIGARSLMAGLALWRKLTARPEEVSVMACAKVARRCIIPCKKCG